MKKINLVILIIILGLTSASCKKFVDGYDKDPNAISYTTPELMMQGVILQNQFFHKADGMRLSMMWMNQATGADRQYKILDDWNQATSEDFNGPWNEVYVVLGQAYLMSELADKNNNQLLRGLGKLYQAWAGGEAASLWGDVPFSQANNKDIENPIFDSQQHVFDQIQQLLDDAIADLSSGNGIIYDSKDIWFKGNASKWIKIAHGLKARFYLHSKQYDLAQQEALQGPSSPNDDLMALFDSNNDQPYGMRNPTWQFMRARDGYMDASDTYAVGLFRSRENNKTKEGGRKTYNYGSNDLNYNAVGSDRVGKFFGNMKLLTYGEMLLIQTECILRDNTKTVADALIPYNTYRALLETKYDTGGFGSASNVRYTAYDPADFNNGGIENHGSNAVSDPKKAFLREVFEERYLFFIGDYESFIDHARSYNDPMVPQYMELSDYDDEPLRFVYPEVEEDANDNFPGSVSITTPLPLYN